MRLRPEAELEGVTADVVLDAVLATVPTRNPVLVLAAGAMGSLWELQRQASAGLQAPVLTHMTWSTLMLRYLPPLFRDGAEQDGPKAEIGRAQG